MRYCAILLEDGIALCCAPVPRSRTPPDVAGVLRMCSPEVIACSADGSLLAVASRTELNLYVVDLELAAEGRERPAARLRGRSRLNSWSKGLDVASLVRGAGPASAHGVAAVVSAAGLALISTATDNGVEAQTKHHFGCALGACRFSDDGTLLALAAIDGRLYVRRAASGGLWASGSSELVWCVHCPCERVLALDFTSCGRWLSLAGWRGDAAVYDCAAFADGAVSATPTATPADAAADAPAASDGAAAAVATKARSQKDAGSRRAEAPAAAATLPGDAPIPEVASWQDWRLSWLQPPKSEASPGPVLVTWCRAPHKSSVLCITNVVARSSGGAETRSYCRLSLVETSGCHAGGGGGASTVASANALACSAGGPVRGLCTARVGGSIGGSGGGSGDGVSGDCSGEGNSGGGGSVSDDYEVAVWIDESGNIGCQTLSSWHSVGSGVVGGRDSFDVHGGGGVHTIGGGGALCERDGARAVLLGTSLAGSVSVLPGAAKDGPHLLLRASEGKSFGSAGSAQAASRVELTLPQLSAEAIEGVLAASASARGGALPPNVEVILGSSHVAIASLGVVQYAEACDGAPWCTFVAEIESACFLGAHTLLMLLAPQPEGMSSAVDVAPSLVALALTAQQHNQTACYAPGVRAVTLTKVSGATALSWSAARLLPPAESCEQDDGKNDLQHHFVLLVMKEKQTMGAWLGEARSGCPPSVVSTHPLHVVLGPGVAPGGVGACAFRCLAAASGAVTVIELVGHDR